MKDTVGIEGGIVVVWWDDGGTSLGLVGCIVRVRMVMMGSVGGGGC